MSQTEELKEMIRDLNEANYLIGRAIPLLTILKDNPEAVKLLNEIRRYAVVGGS